MNKWIGKDFKPVKSKLNPDSISIAWVLIIAIGMAAYGGRLIGKLLAGS